MSFSRPLAYPLTVSAVALAGTAVLMPFTDVDQRSVLAVLALGVIGYTAYRLAIAWARPQLGSDARRVRQEYRLTSRSWVEYRDGEQTFWVPVYFDPALITSPNPAALRLYRSGRRRTREPVGRLIDNPTRPADDAPERAARAARWRRRLLLDAQSAVAAPFFGLLWTYLAGGGVLVFAGATTVGLLLAVWISAIRGSDPS